MKRRATTAARRLRPLIANQGAGAAAVTVLPDHNTLPGLTVGHPHPQY